MRKWIITGGAGFIGCHAADRFHQAGDQVVLVDNLSRRGADVNLAWLQERGLKDFIKADIRDAQAMRSIVADHADADAILHLAAQVAVTTSVADPRADFDINALGTFNVLEAVRLAGGGPAVLYSSTNKVYGNLEHVKVVERGGRYAYEDLPFGVNEAEPLDFHSPYGCSKGAGDQYVRDYGRIYGLKTVVFRQSCIYGTRQFGIEDQGWIAWFCLATNRGGSFTIFGDGKQIRDTLWVGDLIDAYVAAMDRIEDVSGEIFNMGGGPSNTLSLLELVATLETHFGRKLAPPMAGLASRRSARLRGRYPKGGSDARVVAQGRDRRRRRPAPRLDREESSSLHRLMTPRPDCSEEATSPRRPSPMPEIRVCHLGKYYPPAPGGIETHTRTLALAQAELGANVRVFCVHHDSPRTSVEHDGPVEVTRFGRRASAAKIDLCPDLVAGLRSVEADILHMQVPNPTMILSLLRAKPDIPLVVSYQSDVVRQKLRAMVFRPLERLMYRKVRAILAASPTYPVGSRFLRRYRDRVRVLPMGIDLKPYLEPSAEHLRQAEAIRLEEGRGGPLWLACGRQVYYKGFLNAIRALTRVPGRLVLIGDGPDQHALRAEVDRLGVGDRTRFVGNLPHYLDLVPYYLAADAFWFPSNARSEAFGLVQVEAMASRCPVINAEIPHSGVPWVSPHEETGLTVAVDDPIALADAANRLLTEPGLRERLAIAARNRAIREFDHRVMARRSLDLYPRNPRRPRAGLGTVGATAPGSEPLKFRPTLCRETDATFDLRLAGLPQAAIPPGEAVHALQGEGVGRTAPSTDGPRRAVGLAPASPLPRKRPLRRL